MGRSKSKRSAARRDPYASVDPSDKYFGQLYFGMLTSAPYMNLSIGEKQMYTLCRVQVHNPAARKILYLHGKTYEREYDPERCFCFPAAHLKMYGLTQARGSKQLQKLVETGFLDLIEDGSKQRLINVYRFSDRWKEHLNDVVQSRRTEKKQIES